MKAIISIFICLITISAVAQDKNGYTVVSADTLQKLMKDEHFILVDVRTPEEYKEGHIPGAINIDYLNENFNNGLDTLNKDLVYGVYCHSGGRATNSAETMVKKGFKNVYNYEGSMREWKQLGLPVVK
jgi:rhodanese-related sulfurtransferase